MGSSKSTGRHFDIISIQENYRKKFFISLHDEIDDLENDFCGFESFKSNSISLPNLNAREQTLIS